MIRTETIVEYDIAKKDYKTIAMERLNELIKREFIERSDILEFSTNHGTSTASGLRYFSVTISWWKEE